MDTKILFIEDLIKDKHELKKDNQKLWNEISLLKKLLQEKDKSKQDVLTEEKDKLKERIRELEDMNINLMKS
jgi:peptidoglycan hydrolase CwlO-like protein